MTLIGSKRLQQGIFEALASQNRAAGSGGGSGYRAMAEAAPSVHGGNGVGNPGKNYTNTGYVVVQDTGAPVVSASVTIGASTYPTVFFLFGNLSVQGPTAGNSNSQFLVYLDGSPAPNSPLLYCGIPLSGIQPQVATIPLIYSNPLQPGSHTLDVRILVPAATTYQVFSFDLYCFRMGY